MTDYRLPTSVRPTHYELAVRTDLAASPPSFEAEVAISLEVLEDTPSVVFHMHPSLAVTHLALNAGVTHELPISALSTDADTERATVTLADPLKTGSAKLFIRYGAELNGNMMGYYRSNSDPDENGKRLVYALTQFEPTSARRALPCWDEPLFKATFGVTLIAREHEVVLANMDAESSGPFSPAAVKLADVFGNEYTAGSTLAPVFSGTPNPSGWVATRFARTPLMSTYLAAWACGEFAHIEATHTSALTGKAIPLRVYATNNIDQARMTLGATASALKVYEELFGIAYPLPKLDTLVAHDFDMGAMENWGLITGRAAAYFVNKRSSLASLKRCGTIQCHEVAHMWFGNIVTMKWWDNLWLNEAFATLMGSLVLPERIWPEWKMAGEFLEAHWERALSLDAKRSSHPIQVECPDSNKIATIFDAISYSKGASVLRMLMSVVGEVKFFQGVSAYLNKHLYGNAEMQDLWDGISSAVGKDIGEMMNAWTMRVGFPVVRVEELGNGKIKLSQSRFLSTGDLRSDEDETTWWVPLEIKSVGKDGSQVDHSAVLSARSAEYTVRSDTFKLNAETVGVYRVAYTPERLGKLGLQAASFSAADRLGLISDASALAQAGYTSTSGALVLATALAKGEREYLPLSRISSFLSALAGAWWELPLRERIDKLRIEIFKPVVERMGYESVPTDEPEVQELRRLAISVCARAGDADVLSALKERFASQGAAIAPDLRQITFRTVAAHGGEKEYEAMLQVYEQPPVPMARNDAIWALTAARDPKLMQRTVDMIASDAVKDQDVYLFFMGMAANPAARRNGAQYLMDQWDELNKRFHASYGLRNAIAGAFGALSSKEDLAKVETFIKDNDTAKYATILEQAVEGMRARVAWVERDTDDVSSWFAIRE
ncbi:hypothetical protein CspeluHIS016_0405330 [Cutaneotrichosporon spelunceum]|uniref:Aminopeptidase n=1 Tax=Cutaneotrichosporon spelunceum TaxID=1672016 RepID=A0AAD3YDA6_9TREE|nr:hypothetical protein CspeluHIS016_0405330 [Cutaneotrichosporon spelunceum]